MIFNHNEEELHLEIYISPYRPATRFSPEEPAEFEITEAKDDRGNDLPHYLVEHLIDYHYDEICNQADEEAKSDRNSREVENYLSGSDEDRERIRRRHGF